MDADNDNAAPAAVVLLSGGLDSTTCLAIARDQGYRCHTLSIDYGQSHQSELYAAADTSSRLGAAEHRVVSVDVGQFGGSALTDDDIAIPVEHTVGIPMTYVPARNTIMLAIALGWAEVLNARTIFVGVNAVDYSGYPDCRPEFIAAFNQLAALATKTGVENNPVRVLAPLQQLSKAEIIQRGIELNVDYSLTVSCYQARDDGSACGNCDACRLRKAGFREAGLDDPTRYI